MKCCGEDRTTPFCPQCGERLGKPSPLVSLLAHLRAGQKAREKLLAKYRQWEAADGADERSQRLVKGKERAVLKWAEWADALEALIRPQEVAPGPG